MRRNMLKRIKIAISLMTLVCLHAQAGTILKCQAADGSITYADTRCPGQQTLLSKQKHQPQIKQPPRNIKNIEHMAEFPPDQKQLPFARQVFQAKFVQALSSISTIKISMTEYYLMRGEWPENLAAMGFEAGDMSSSTIQQTQVMPEGRLLLKLVKDFGEDKQIWIYPHPVMGGTQIEWICYSNFPSYNLKNTAGGILCNSRNF